MNIPAAAQSTFELAAGYGALAASMPFVQPAHTSNIVASDYEPSAVPMASDDAAAEPVPCVSQGLKRRRVRKTYEFCRSCWKFNGGEGSVECLARSVKKAVIDDGGGQRTVWGSVQLPSSGQHVSHRAGKPCPLLVECPEVALDNSETSAFNAWQKKEGRKSESENKFLLALDEFLVSVNLTGGVP